MRSEQSHHEELIRGISKQLEPILEKSTQDTYTWTTITRCNKKFGDLLGYKSPKEWAEIDVPC